MNEQPVLWCAVCGIHGDHRSGFHYGLLDYWREKQKAERAAIHAEAEARGIPLGVLYQNAFGGAK